MILPAARAIFRNVAETMNALEFVNSRSEIEALATQRTTAELERCRVTCDGVYAGNVHLDASEAGRKLIMTQTEREVAVNQQKLYGGGADHRPHGEGQARRHASAGPGQKRRRVISGYSAGILGRYQGYYPA